MVIKKPLSVAPTEADVTYIKMEDVKGWFVTSALTSPDVDAIERFLSGARSFGKGPWKIKSIDAMRSFLSPKGPDYLTKVTRVMDDCEAKDISALKITYKGDTKGLNDARGEMVKLVEPVRAALESKSPFLGASIPERVIFIDKVAASKDAEAEFTKVLEQHIMYARSRCLELAPSPP